MRKILIIWILMIASLSAQSFDLCYVVNNITDTTNTALQYDRRFIRYFNDYRGYTVHVITDDSAALITNLNDYDGYYISATATGTSLAALKPTTKGVLIADNESRSYFDFATNVVAGFYYGTDWRLNRTDSTEWASRRMSNQIYFAFNSNSIIYAFRGVPSSAKKLFSPVGRGFGNEADSGWCFIIPQGGALATSGTAAGHRGVIMPMYPMMTATTYYGGYCHPWELLGNMAGQVFSDTLNPCDEKICFSYDRGGELEMMGAEFPSSSLEMFAWARIGNDYGASLLFVRLPNWSKKLQANHKADSLIWFWRYNGAGFESPPAGDVYSGFNFWAHIYAIADSISWECIKVDSTSYAPVRADSSVKVKTILNDTTIAVTAGVKYNFQYLYNKGSYIIPQSGAAYGEKRSIWSIKNGTTAQGVVNGDTIYYTSAFTGAIAEGDSLKLWGRVRHWPNRFNSRNDTTGGTIIPWGTADLQSGRDYSVQAFDSFLFNSSTMPQSASSFVKWKVDGSMFSSLYNGMLVKTSTVGPFRDSMDIEIAGASINNPCPSTPYVNGQQEFWLYTSPSEPPISMVADLDTVYFIATAGGGNPAPKYNIISEVDNKALTIDNISEATAWLTANTVYGNEAPVVILNSINIIGLSPGVHVGSVTVNDSDATPTSITYYVHLTLNAAPTSGTKLGADVKLGTGIKM